MNFGRVAYAGVKSSVVGLKPIDLLHKSKIQVLRRQRELKAEGQEAKDFNPAASFWDAV